MSGIIAAIGVAASVVGASTALMSKGSDAPTQTVTPSSYNVTGSGAAGTPSGGGVGTEQAVASGNSAAPAAAGGGGGGMGMGAGMGAQPMQQAAVTSSYVPNTFNSDIKTPS